MRKFSVLLGIFVISAIFVILNAAWGEENLPYRGQIRAYTDPENHAPIEIQICQSLGARFDAPAPFTQLTVRCPSFSNNIGGLTLALYRWQENYAATITEKPLVSKRFDDFADNETLALVFEPLDAGEYLWTLSDPTEKVGVWKILETLESVEAYQNGEPTDGTYQFAVEFATAFPFFGDWTTYRLLQTESTAPPETNIEPDESAAGVDPRTWDAIDELGRVLPDSGQTGPVRDQKQVGIFYWTWHNSLEAPGPFDNTKITAEHPEAVGDINHPAWGPLGASHHWGEPLFGYYTTRDEWIHRRHAEMLADAGVDAVIFDATNATLTWMESVEPLMKVYAQARRDGVKTPKFAFMLPFWALEYTATDLVQLWRDIYRDGRYQELWFYWDGKPLIYGLPDALDRLIPTTEGAEKEELLAIRKFFSFRPGQPAYTGGPRRPDQWSWLEVYPQHGYGARADGSFDMVSVGVAQNHSSCSRSGRNGLSAMNDQNIFGRAHVEGEPLDTRPDADLWGGNFEQQWSRAFELDPRFVFVTGWNEWVAGRFPVWQDLPNAFPDQYNEPFSRDTEPERGRLMDNYYMQLTAHIRKFKGVPPQKAAGKPTSIDLERADTADPWADVAPIYRDYRGDTLHRDALGYGQIHYVNDSGRNDLVTAKTTHDNTYLYFMIETNEPLTPAEGADWMRLFLATDKAWRPDADEAGTPHWEHFDFLIEQTATGATLKKSTGGWNWIDTAAVKRRIGPNRLELAIPLASLGLSPEKIDLRFKWSDHMRVDGDILDFYQYGDCAPDGRFAYRYFTAP